LFGISSSKCILLAVFATSVYKLHKVVDSVSCFLCNSTKYELRITLEFWQMGGEVKIPHFYS